jgi:peroxiredoxin
MEIRMALTPSTMLPLGSLAPSFNLVDVRTNQRISLANNHSEIATVIMFICNHCPYVKHIQTNLVEVANRYQAKGIYFIAISSNDEKTYPADSPSEMKKIAEEYAYPFPYLFDETQDIAKAYQAACTPDFYVFDKALKCIYRGRFDASNPGNNIPTDGSDLTNALDSILANRAVDENQKASIGCNIKWKK